MAYLEPVVDSMVLAVPVLLSACPLEQDLPEDFRRLDEGALCALVSVLGTLGALLAQYPRAADHSRRICLWLQRLGSTSATNPATFEHLCPPLLQHALLEALVKVYEVAPSLARE